MKKVAVTGGLASGKTTVCQILRRLGAYVVDSDEIVHDLLTPHTPLGKDIKNLLGEDVLTDGKFDRKKIAAKVFSNPDQLRALEKILHPAVITEIEKRFQTLKNAQQYTLFVAEVPLLYESDLAKHFDTVIAVIADPKLSRARSKHKVDFEERIQRQLAPHEKAARADIVITNNGSLKELEEQVVTIQRSLTGQ